MEKINVYVAYETTDEYGRLGSILGVKNTEHAAEQLAKGRGWWGGPGCVLRKEAIYDNGTYYIIEGQITSDVMRLRKVEDQLAALNVLTDEQIELLELEPLKEKLEERYMNLSDQLDENAETIKAIFGDHDEDG